MRLIEIETQGYMKRDNEDVMMEFGDIKYNTDEMDKMRR